MVDRVLEQARPLCRYCDPRLADYLRRIALAANPEAQAAADVLLAPVEPPEDPTGRGWAA